MKQKITQTACATLLVIIVLLNAGISQAQQQTYANSNNSGMDGYSIVRADEKGLNINFSINGFSTAETIINGKSMRNLSVSGIFLPNEAGYPDLPGNQRYIAIPQGSKAILKVISYNTETIKGIDIAPAPVIPQDKIEDIGTAVVYEKNDAIYSRNSFYPENPVILSEAKKIRGVDVVSLGIMPFQYNPVTKELIVYKDIQIEISFEGGNGHFGDDAYRSRWWEPILSDMILNYNQLPVIDANSLIRKQNAKITADTGCEYAIIIPNAPEFAQWADSIKKFRTEQGILTNIYKLSNIGTTALAIQTWVAAAYTTWDIKPAAILILADYGTDANSTVIANMTTGFASDNYYADVTGDYLPDITFSRIPANNAAQLQVMCSKFLNYERNPPTDAAFYNKPLMVMGWQDDRWYQLGSEIITGYLKSFKSPVRVNALGNPANNTGSAWSSVNPATIVTYFGQSGLKYIPNAPGTLGGFTGGNSTAINTAINNGAFMVWHRDHGGPTAWQTPYYGINSMTIGLANGNNKLPFVFSINCSTGEYQSATECLSEKLHRYTKNGQNSGALGVVAPTDISYAFVNDVHIWGMFDNMWPNFMPAYGTSPASRDMRPAFANDAGKYFLEQSNWDNTDLNTKRLTYRLFHTFGDAFQWFYSEVPQNLAIVHNSTINLSATTFDVTANLGSFIAITTSTPSGPIILGTATGTGSPVAIPLSQSPTDNILVTVTKQNYFRYSKLVSLVTSVEENNLNNFNLTCYPNPFSQSTTISYSLDKPGNVTLSIYDVLGKEVTVIINNTMQSGGTHQIQFSNKNLPPGAYSCVLKTGSDVITKSIIIK